VSATSVPVSFSKQGATLAEVLESQDRDLEHVPRVGETVVWEAGETWRVTAVEWYLASEPRADVTVVRVES
jgi:hypothetical protein